VRSRSQPEQPTEEGTSTGSTVYGALPAALTQPADTTLSRLAALAKRAKETSFADFALPSNATLFLTPQRTRSDISRIMNSIDGIVDLTDTSASETESVLPVQSSERVFKMSTRHDHK
jgi:hypothetical protein